MANKRVSELAADTNPQAGDLLLLSDVAAFESKKLTLGDLATFVLSGGRLTGSLAGTASYALRALVADTATFISSSVSASFSITASYALNNSPGGISISSSWASQSLSSSYSTFSATTGHVVLADSSSIANYAATTATASYLYYSGTDNGTVQNAISALTAISSTTAASAVFATTSTSSSWASQSLSASYANITSVDSASYSSYSDVAGTALIGITTNVQSSASWASQSLFATLAQTANVAISAQSASFLAPVVQAQQQGIFLALTQSNQTSQLDSVGVTAYFPFPVVTASIEAVGTVIAYYTSSITLNESVSLYILDRSTGNLVLLDSTPIYVNIQGQYSSITASISANIAGQLSGSITGSTSGSIRGIVSGSISGSFTSSFTGSASGSMSGSMTGSYNGNMIGNYTGSLTSSINAYYNGALTGSLTGSISTLLSGSIKFPFNLMGQASLATVNSSPGAFMVYISASSNLIQLEPSRKGRFNIFTQNAAFNVSADGLLQLTTNVATDTFTFSSSMGGPFVDTATNIVTVSGSSAISAIDISSIYGGIKYIWSLNNLKSISSYNNLTITDIQGMPQSIVTMSLRNGALTSLSPLNTTSASILICSNNQLISLPSLPFTMSYIDCSNNNILTLPNSLPYGLTTFIADSNYITTTSTSMPASIVSMSFANNTYLTTWTSPLPSSLVSFNCSYCNLSTLPQISTNVVYLNAKNNSFSSAAEDFIIATLVSSGKINGYLDLTNNAAITSPTTLANISTLFSRGWSVLY